jgi:hypothetical protein
LGELPFNFTLAVHGCRMLEAKWPYNVWSCWEGLATDMVAD